MCVHSLFRQVRVHLARILEYLAKLELDFEHQLDLVRAIGRLLHVLEDLAKHAVRVQVLHDGLLVLKALELLLHLF